MALNRRKPSCQSCEVGQCKYVLIANNEGGLLNDPVLLRLAENHFLLKFKYSDLVNQNKNFGNSSSLTLKMWSGFEGGDDKYNGKYAVAYVDGNEFPKAAQVSDAKKTKLKSNILYTAITSTLFASGNDDLRPVMSGVFFQFSIENSTFVATDAHKLVRYVRTDYKSDKLVEFIMPKKPLNILKGILGKSVFLERMLIHQVQ